MKATADGLDLLSSRLGCKTVRGTMQEYSRLKKVRKGVNEKLDRAAITSLGAFTELETVHCWEALWKLDCQPVGWQAQAGSNRAGMCPKPGVKA